VHQNKVVHNYEVEKVKEFERFSVSLFKTTGGGEATRTPIVIGLNLNLVSRYSFIVQLFKIY